MKKANKKGESLESIMGFLFMIGFMVWFFWPFVFGTFTVTTVLDREISACLGCVFALAAWVTFTVWFVKSDPERVAKKKAAQRALHATEFELVSVSYGTLRFEHLDYEIGSHLIGEPPPLFYGNTGYSLYVRRAKPDIVFVTKQLKWLDGMYDIICEKMIDRLEYVCGYRGLPLSGRPEGYDITSVSLPESKKEDIMLYGFFTGIKERYAGEAILHIFEKGVKCTIDTGRDDDCE